MSQSDMKITKIEVWNFKPHFSRGPYIMSHVAQDAAHGRLLRVHTDNGIPGLGEIVFPPSLGIEKRRQRILNEREYLSRMVGRDFNVLTSFAQEVRDRDKSWRGVGFGLETAHLDLKARCQDRSLADLLGGALNDAVDDYFSISERSIDQIRRRLAIAGPEHAVIQLKIGIGSLQDDIAQVAATLDTMTEDQTLLADTNGGWSVSEACEVIASFDDPRLVWEEPCANYEDNIAVARRSKKPVLVDQCVGDLVSAIRAIEEHIVSAICIKPAFLGGLTIARKVRDLCEAKGVKMRIDGPWCGDIATAAILNLAVGAPSNLLIAGCDLREPLDIKPNLNGVVTLSKARIAPPSGTGLGIELERGQLGPPEAIYQ